MKGLPLAGRRIVVTRPKGQAETLVGLIRQAGGEPLEIPALEIRDLADLAPFYSVIERLEGICADPPACLARATEGGDRRQRQP